MRYRDFAACGLGLLLAAACASSRAGSAASPEGDVTTAVPPGVTPLLAQRIPLDRALRLDSLANGLRYYVRDNGWPEGRLELRLVVNAGSVVEEDHEQGFAHVLEHMAFNGTQHFAAQELVDYLESIGVAFGSDVNAHTGFDATVYELRVPTDSLGTVRTGLEVLADWAGGMLLDGAEIDKERKVIVEEWRSSRGAAARLRDQQLPILLHGARYAQRLPIGQLAVIDTFTHGQLRAFHRAWYRPELMAVIAVGDCDRAWLEEQIRTVFGALPAVADARPRPAFPVPEHRETLFAIATDPEATATRVTVYVKSPAPDQSTVGAYRRHLARLLYERMLNQRLYELSMLAEPPFLSAASGTSLLVATAQAQVLSCQVAEGKAATGLEAMLREARRVQVHGFLPAELDRAGREMLRAVEQAYRERDRRESTYYAAEYVRHFLESEPSPGIEYELGLYRTFLPQITLAEVVAAAAPWNGEANRVVAVTMPAAEAAPAPTEQQLRAAFAKVEAETLAAYVEDPLADRLVDSLATAGSIVGESGPDELGVTRWQLSNGVRVVLKPTDFRNDEVLFTASSPGGHSLAADSDFVAAVTADGVVQESGVGRFDKIALRKALAGKVARVEPWIDELQEGMRGGASPEDLETLFQLIYLHFVAPRADSTAYASYRNWLLDGITNRAASPEAAFADTVAVLLAQHHFRARPWTAGVIDEMDLGGSLRIYRDRMADAGDFTFYFVGNVDVAVLRPLVCSYLASLPATGRRESWRDVGMQLPAGVTEQVVRRGVEPKSRTRLVFVGDEQWSHDRALALEGLADVLRIKLREVLREDLGGTYGVGVSASLVQYPRGAYSLAIGFGCAPERADEMTAVVMAQLDTLARLGPDSVQVEKVRSMAVRAHEVELRENSYWLELLGAADFHGVQAQQVLAEDTAMAALTRERLQEAAARYLNRRRYVRVVLLPAEPAPTPSPTPTPTP